MRRQHRLPYGSFATWQIEINFVEVAATPAQRQMGAVLFFVDRDDNFFEHDTQQFLPVAYRGRWCVPNLQQISAERQ